MPKMRQARRHGGTRMWSLLMPPPQRATSIVCAITSVSITRALLLSLTAALCTRVMLSAASRLVLSPSVLLIGR